MKSETIKSILIAALLCVDIYEERLRRSLKNEIEGIPKLSYVNTSYTTNTITILERLEKLEKRQNLYFTNGQLYEL